MRDEGKQRDCRLTQTVSLKTSNSRNRGPGSLPGQVSSNHSGTAREFWLLSVVHGLANPPALWDLADMQDKLESFRLTVGPGPEVKALRNSRGQDRRGYKRSFVCPLLPRETPCKVPEQKLSSETTTANISQCSPFMDTNPAKPSLLWAAELANVFGAATDWQSRLLIITRGQYHVQHEYRASFWITHTLVMRRGWCCLIRNQALILTFLATASFCRQISWAFLSNSNGMVPGGWEARVNLVLPPFLLQTL